MVIHFSFKPVNPGTTSRCTIASIRTISSMSCQGACRKSSVTISAPTSISVIRANRRSVRRYSCIDHQRRTIPTRRSATIGRTRRIFRGAWSRPLRSGEYQRSKRACSTGREPDENRYDFDRPRFDSYSGRLSWNPTKNLALQVSHGYIKSPEAVDPKTNIHRTTASAIYNLPLGPDRNWSNSFVWGQNNATEEGKTQSFLIESNYQRGRDTVYFRWERVQKSGHELVSKPSDESEIFPSERVLARLRSRLITWQRHRHRSWHPIHYQRPPRHSGSLLRRRSRLRLPIFSCVSGHLYTVTANTTTRSTLPERRSETVS